MKNSKPDHFFPHKEPQDNRYARGNEKEQSAALPIAVRETTGNAADKNKNPRKKSFHRLKEEKKRPSPGKVKQITNGIKSVKQYHEDYIEPPHLVHKVNAAGAESGLRRGLERRVVSEVYFHCE